MATATEILKSGVNPVSGNPLTETQKATLRAQELSSTQAQRARDEAMAKSLAGSKTINDFTSQNPADIAAQQSLNTKYNLPATTGLTGAPVPMQRDYAKEVANAKKVGITDLSSITREQEQQLFKMTYTPQQLSEMGLNDIVSPPLPTGITTGAGISGEAPLAQPVYDPAKLKAMGLSDEQIAALSGTGQQANTAQAGLEGAPRPENSNLYVLQNALKMVNGVGATGQPATEGELSSKLGLGTPLSIESLNSAINAVRTESAIKYDNYAQMVQVAGSNILDTYKVALDTYKTVSDQYNKDVDRMMETAQQLKEHQWAMDQIIKADELERETYLWKKQVETAYGGAANKELKFDPKTGEAIVFDPSTGGMVRAGGGNTLLPSKMSAALQVPDGAVGGECGHYVNGGTGLGLGDTFADKMAKMEKSITIPEPGMVFVMDYTDPKYGRTGHTGFIMSGVDEKGMVMVKDSNWNKDHLVLTHKIRASSITGLARVTISDADVLKRAQEAGLDITNKAAKETILDNYNTYGILPEQGGNLPSGTEWVKTALENTFGNIKGGEANVQRKINKFNELIQSGKGQEAASLAYNSLFGKLASGEMTKLNDGINLKRNYEELKAAIDELKVATGTTGGIVGGSLNALLRTLKATRPDEAIRLEARINKSYANYGKSISGAAISEQEAQRLLKQFPTMLDPESTQKVLSEELYRESSAQLDQKINSYSQNMFSSADELNAALDDIRMGRYGNWEEKARENWKAAKTIGQAFGAEAGAYLNKFNPFASKSNEIDEVWDTL